MYASACTKKEEKKEKENGTMVPLPSLMVVSSLSWSPPLPSLMVPLFLFIE
jgi:hypothetical protein